MKIVMCVGAFLFVAAGTAQAQLVETFDDPFGDWNNRWFYQNSNAESYYMASGDSNDPNYRGNNPAGLWIASPQGFGAGVGGSVMEIVFDLGFAATLASLSFGTECFVMCDISAYDVSNNLLATGTFSGGGFDFDHSAVFSAASGNGISRVVFDSTAYGGSQIEGNTSIDNVRATVPAPAGIAVIGALGLAAGRRRR